MKRVTLSAHGATVRLDVDPGDHIGGRIARRQDWYERDLLEDLRHRVRRGGVAVDVGAHIGNHTTWLAAVCGLRVVAIEPSPKARVQLLRNVYLSRLGDQVEVIGAAAGTTQGTAALHPAGPGNTGMTRAVPTAGGDVPVVAIDSLRLDDVTVMKIDVEGSELDVLAGARETIRRHRPVLYIETGNEQLPAVDALLAGHGYTRFGTYAITPTHGYVHRDDQEQIRLSTAIMAHPKREPFVRELLDDLDGPAEVVWDKHNDRWDTGRRSLLAHDPAATHHLVIQDDVQPCQELLAGCTRLLAHVPAGHPVALYMGRARIEPYRFPMSHLTTAARRKHAAFAAFEGPWWGQAVIVPTQEIEAVVAFGDTHPEITNYDHRIAWYFNSVRTSCYYTVPSLVEHRTGPGNPSLLAHGNGGGRRADSFIGRDRTPASVDWSRGAVTPSDLPPLPRSRFPSTPRYPGP